MATNSLLIEASPLKMKQQTLLRTFRPFPSKIKSSTETFSFQRCFSAPRIFTNPKLPLCYSLAADKIRYITADAKSDHPSLSTQCLDVFKDHQQSVAAGNPNFRKLWEKCLKVMRKPATTAVVLGLLVMYNPNSPALAAPVGRVGGRYTSSSGTTTSYHQSENSSTKTKIKSADVDRFDDVVDVVFVGVILYLLGILSGGLLLLPKDFPECLQFLRAPLLILWTFGSAYLTYNRGQTSVVKFQLQVNLSTGRALQMDLNRIAKTADSKTFEGLRYILRDTAVALLRQPDYRISNYSSVVIPKFSRVPALQFFNKLAARERARYESEETIVNVDKVKTQNIASQTSTNDPQNDYVVVTILLATDGNHSKSLSITERCDVKRVLEELASMHPNKLIFGLEVLWTPPLPSNAASDN